MKYKIKNKTNLSQIDSEQINTNNRHAFNKLILKNDNFIFMFVFLYQSFSSFDFFFISVCSSSNAHNDNLQRLDSRRTWIKRRNS